MTSSIRQQNQLKLYDVLVVGAGPAGLIAASRCAERGLDVAALAPDPEAIWRNNYGGWVDELGEIEGQLSARWSGAQVCFDASGSRTLDRAYARVDAAALQQRLLESCAGVHLHRGEALGSTADASGVTVHLRGGGSARARVVIDASGGRPALLQPGEDRRPAAWQIAYGQLIEVDAHPWPLDQVVLMDFRTDAIPDAPTTFLYVMPLGPELVFVEETSLAAAPPVDLTLLEGRLSRRLAAQGIRPRRILDEERCRILMNAPMPSLQQQIVGFGASSGMIHPATGYLLGRALARGPALADAIAQGLDDGGDPVRAAAGAWRAVWPARARKARSLHLFGLDVLLEFDNATLQQFFDAFFSLPVERWSAYMAADASGGEVAEAMTSLFLRAPAPIRRRLFSSGARARRSLLQTLMPRFGGVT